MKTCQDCTHNKYGKCNRDIKNLFLIEEPACMFFKNKKENNIR